MDVLCLSRTCCFTEEDASKIMDLLSAISLAFRRHPHEASEVSAVMRDLEAARNAMHKVAGGIRALRSRFKNLRSFDELNDTESVVNTIVNVLNRLVEVRNLIQRTKEVAEDMRLNDIAQEIESSVPALDSVIARAALIGLRISLNLPRLTRDDSGKLASAIGTALFASLLSLHEAAFRKEMSRCVDSHRVKLR